MKATSTTTPLYQRSSNLNVAPKETSYVQAIASPRQINHSKWNDLREEKELKKQRQLDDRKL